jgi:hypothetical protein
LLKHGGGKIFAQDARGRLWGLRRNPPLLSTKVFEVAERSGNRAPTKHRFEGRGGMATNHNEQSEFIFVSPFRRGALESLKG